MPLPALSLDTITLDRGAHDDYTDGVCVMELAAWLARVPEITDHPPCVSPVLGAFLRSWNDGLDDDSRQMLKPYAAKVLNTADDRDDARAWLAADWLARTCAPAFLRLLPSLEAHADALVGLSPLDSPAAAVAARPVLAAARDAARAAARAAAMDAARAAAMDAARAAPRAAARDAAMDAARDAASAAAWDAAMDAARDAASAAAWDAARAAAGDAAWDAARAAAWDAARDALAPTVRELRTDALSLLDRMIAA